MLRLMIDLQQWRASIGLNNARGRRASRRSIITSTKQGAASLPHINTAGRDHKRMLAVALYIFAAIIIIECTSNIHTSLTGECYVLMFSCMEMSASSVNSAQNLCLSIRHPV